MNLSFNSYKSSVSRYDALFDEAGNHMNEVSFLYSAFVSEVLKIIGSEISLPNLNIPVYNGTEYKIACATGLFLDSERGFPHAALDDGKNIPFVELNVSAQDLIVQTVFMEIKTADVYRSLFSDDERQ